VYFGYPVRSHTIPGLALVRSLVDRGAKVDYHSTPDWSAQVQSTGARFIPYRLTRDIGGPPAAALSVEEYADIVSALSAELNPTLTDAAGEADLVIFDVSAHWGVAAAHRAAVPAVSFATTFAFTRPMLQLMQIRDPRRLDILAPPADLKIVCTSREYQPVGQSLGDDYVFAGPLIDQRPRAGQLVGKTGSRPLAYVSLGTLFNLNGDLLLKVARSLSLAGYEAIVALGGNSSAMALEWPEHVRAFPFVDQISALRAADLAVTHAGMAGMSEIMSCGIPAIAIPQAVDQFLVARRTESLGAAVTIGRDSDIEATLPAALARVRQNESAMRAAAQRIAQSFTAVTPLREITDRVLTLAARSVEGRKEVCQ
jgi:UDP:flavonoid glycosyltransferase YjiC (YdhE family)